MGNIQEGVSGNQRLVTSLGLLRCDELYEYGKDLVLFDNNKAFPATKMEKSEEVVDIYQIKCYNGLTHEVSKNHKFAIRDYVRYNLVTINDVRVNMDRCRLQQNKGLFGKNSRISNFNPDKIPSEVWTYNEELMENYYNHFKNKEIKNQREFMLIGMNLDFTSQVSSKILTIESIGKDYVYSTTCSSPDNLYICNGFLTSK